MIKFPRRLATVVGAGVVAFAPVLVPAAPASALTLAGPQVNVAITGLPGNIQNPFNGGALNVGLSNAFEATITNAGPGNLIFTTPSTGLFPVSASPGLTLIAGTGFAHTVACRGALSQGSTCVLGIDVLATAPGPLTATINLENNSANRRTQTVNLTGAEGYYIADQGGGAAYFDSAGVNANTGEPPYVQNMDRPLNAPVVTVASTQDGMGYYEAAADGGIFTFGDANGGFFGSKGGEHLNQPIVGMAIHPTQSGFAAGTGGVDGYYEVASDGGIFTFGAGATFLGSKGGAHLNSPIVGMAVTTDGGGYYLVASDGGIFTFGDATFHGSTGSQHLNMPIVGMALSPDGGGYYLVASDGGIFTFGDATFHGSEGAHPLNQPIVGMATTPDGGGYWLEAKDGGSFTFGNAPYVQDGLLAAYPGVIGISPTAQPVVSAPQQASTGGARAAFHGTLAGGVRTDWPAR